VGPAFGRLLRKRLEADDYVQLAHVFEEISVLALHHLIPEALLYDAFAFDLYWDEVREDVIRTRKLPFLQSRASGPLIAMTAAIMSVGVLIPFTPIGPYLGFTTLPPLYWLLLGLTLLAYMLLTQGVKAWLIRRVWI